MNKENIDADEKLKKAYEQMPLELLIFSNLCEFKETRAIATAVEICDLMLKGTGLDEDI